jgi:hypothetical protein
VLYTSEKGTERGSTASALTSSGESVLEGWMETRTK